MIKVKCPDCRKIVMPEKDYCHIHIKCQDYAYMCPKCESLNVDVLVRLKTEDLIIQND